MNIILLYMKARYRQPSGKGKQQRACNSLIMNVLWGGQWLRCGIVFLFDCFICKDTKNYPNRQTIRIVFYC